MSDRLDSGARPSGAGVGPHVALRASHIHADQRRESTLSALSHDARPSRKTDWTLALNPGRPALQQVLERRETSPLSPIAD